MSLHNCEHRFYLYHPIEDFGEKYETYNRKEAKELFLMLLDEFKRTILEGNLEHFKLLTDKLNYINDFENTESLKNYIADATNPIKSTNLVILSCKHYKPQILHFLLVNCSILKNISRYIGRNIMPDDKDDECHNSFYYALRSGNVKLIDTLINYWPNNYFSAHPMELDDILSRSYEELKLRNVAVSTEIEIYVETKLLNLRFYSSSDKEVSIGNDDRHNIGERVRLVLENINLLEVEYFNRDVDERFLHIAKFIVLNLFVLKRRLKSTYDILPWEELEYCLVSYVSIHTKEQEINLFYNAFLDKSKIIYYLKIFSEQLEKVVKGKDIKKLNNLPKLQRAKVIADNLKHNIQFAELYDTHEKIRDVHSMQKINGYISLALAADAKGREGRIIIIRALQVIGEYLKDTLESPNLSITTSSLLLLLLPKNTREIIIDLRNSLSHAYALNKRTEIEEQAEASFFLGIQNDTKKVGIVITDILHKHKMKIIRMLLKEIFNSENLSEMKEVTKQLGNFHLDPISSDSFKLLEYQKLEKLIEELSNIIPLKTNNEQYIFKRINTIINDLEEKNKNFKIDYTMGCAALKSFAICLNDDKIDNYFITGMKCRASKVLQDITLKLDPNYLKEIAKLTSDICCSVQSKMKENDLERLHKIMLEVFFIIEFEVGSIKQIQDLREKISEKYFVVKAFKQNVMSENNHKRLQGKLTELKSVLSSNFLDNELIQHYSSYKHDKKLQALIEMLVLDIMSILACSKNCLENNYFLLDGNAPLLTGKYLRNHLAHYNNLVDLLLTDPLIAVVLNANKLTLENISKGNKKIGKSVSDNPLRLELKFHQDLITIANQERMFKYLQEGNLDGLKSCLSNGADINARNISLWTSIHFAAKGTNFKILKFLIDQNINVNVTTVNGQTPLHVAATFGRKNMIDFFLKLGLNIHDQDKEGKTALHLAAQKGHKDTANVLLSNKANAFAMDMVGLLPLYYAVRNDHIEVVRIMLKNDINVDVYKAAGGFTPLHEAAEGGHLEIVQFLLQKRANVNAKNYRNLTPLHIAARNGYPEVVSALISTGANVNAMVINGCTSLHYAAETGHKDIVNSLLLHGAIINVCNENGEIPLHGAVKNGHNYLLDILLSKDNASIPNKEGITSLHFAAQKGYFQIVVDLLACNADPRAKSRYGFTPLHYAAEGGYTMIADLLLRHGALINVKTNDGFSALYIATAKGHQDVFNLLIENKAEVNAKTKGSTLLHTAVFSNKTDMINILLKNNVDINATSTDGLTPLYFAVLNGRKDIFNLLLQNNANVNCKNAANQSLLHDAVQYGQKDIIEILIENNVNLNAKDNIGLTALHIAVESGQKDIVKILIASGASINIKTKNNLTPLILAVKHNYIDIVDIFLSNAVNVNFESKEPLIVAVYAGFVDVLEVFLKHNAYINMKYDKNITLLHIAVSEGHEEVVNKLLSKGADVNAINVHKETPLYFAAQAGHVEIFEILMGKGSSLDIINDEGFTLLHIAAARGSTNVVKLLMDKNKANLKLKDFLNRTPIELAVANGHLEVVKTLLEYKEIDINSKGNDDYTILHIAAQENKIDIVKYLLIKGAYINAVNSSGSKPIHIAAKEGNKDIVEFFLSKGCCINDLGASNQNILFYATMKGHLELLKYLIAQGADVNATDTNMLTPMHIAAYFGFNDIIRELLKNGAVYNVFDINNRKPLNAARKIDTQNLLASIEKLFDAVKCNNVSEVLNQVQAGAYVNSKNIDGKAPLHYAASKGYNDIVLVLLQYKADSNIADLKELTPLHYAAQFSHLSVVKSLLCNGAIYNAASDSGKTPLNLTEDESIASILELVNKSFNSVENNDLKIMYNLNKIKDTSIVKAIMNAHNIDNRSLIVTAVLNNFVKVEELKGILQDNVSYKVNIAITMLNEDNCQAALPIFRNIFEERKEIFGANNPGCLDIQTYIAKVFFKQGLYKETLKMLEDIYQKQREMFGLNDKNTLSTRSMIALVLHRQGRDEEALNMYQDVNMMQKKILGKNHTETLETQLHMALVLDRLEKCEEALSMNHEVYKKREEQKHPAALNAQNNIAMVLNHQEKYEEALEVFKQVLEKKKVLLGTNNSGTIRTQHNIAGVLFNLKKYHESRKAFQEVLNMRKNILGVYHPDTLITQSNLGDVFFAQKNWNCALEAYKEGLEERKIIWGSSHQNVLDILNKIQTVKFNLKLEVGSTAENLEHVLIDIRKAASTAENLEHVVTDIHKAASLGDTQTIQKLLKNGVNINDKDINGRTPFHYAVDRRRLGTLDFLLKNGADATSVTNKGNTALHTAAVKSYEEVIEVLLQNISRGKLHDFINAQTFAGGSTAMHVAAKIGSSHIVTSLLKHGATYNIKNKENKIPVELSSDPDTTDLLKLIEELFEDAKKGNYEIILKLKVLKQDDLIAATNARDNCHKTLLQISGCKNKNISREILEIMQKIG